MMNCITGGCMKLAIVAPKMRSRAVRDAVAMPLMRVLKGSCGRISLSSVFLKNGESSFLIGNQSPVSRGFVRSIYVPRFQQAAIQCSNSVCRVNPMVNDSDNANANKRVGGLRGLHSAVATLGAKAASPAFAEYAVAEQERHGLWSGGGDSFSDSNDNDRGGNTRTSDDGEGLEIAKLGIDQEIVSALANRGITKLFPIQRAVLEPALEGRDMIGRARTGTGKTLAFGIPILDKIYQHNRRHGRGMRPLALVMAPTRELARQVDKEFQETAPGLDTLCVYGGVPIYTQMNILRRGIDIAVGTPGRIIDLIKREALDLSEVQFVVLDEADQMLAVGFEEDVEMILERLPKKRQSMLFSATMPIWVKKLARRYLDDPLVVDLVGDSDKKLAEGISLYSIIASNYGKRSILGNLISEYGKGGKCIVFTQTKRDADGLAMSMSRTLGCEALHGDISQNQRERTLAAFRDGRFNVLIATDVAARGLDIPNVDLVIHYEIPNSSELFVHRSGRTGRAGRKGNAILIYSEQQIRAVRVIEQDTGCKFTELPRMTEEIDDRDKFGGYAASGGNRFGSYGNSGGGRFGGYSSSGGGYGRPRPQTQSNQFDRYSGDSGSRFDDYGSRPGYQTRPSQFDRNSQDYGDRLNDYGSHPGYQKRPSRFDRDSQGYGNRSSGRSSY